MRATSFQKRPLLHPDIFVFALAMEAKSMLESAPARKIRKEAECRFCQQPIPVGGMAFGRRRLSHEECAVWLLTMLGQEGEEILLRYGYKVVEAE